MRASLPAQARLAPDFLRQAWPPLLEQALDTIGPWRESVSSVLACGCGDSHFAAQGAEFALRLWAGRRARAACSMSGGRYLSDTAHPGCLVIGISASGEVARTIEAVEQARRVGAHTLALTSTRSSTLAQASGGAIVAVLPDVPFGPGLISYLASLLSLLAVAAALADGGTRERVADLVESLPASIAGAAEGQEKMGRDFAEQVADSERGVFLGSGPGFGAAGFAAAKVMEACGLDYHAQDIEEWAHLEYFHSWPETPTWLLTSGGREASRAMEVEGAAHAIGRRVAITRWVGSAGWSLDEREALSPFGLWPAPVAFAQRLMELLGEQPFRSFGGGRSPSEGGGASRIRTSERLAPGPTAGASG